MTELKRDVVERAQVHIRKMRGYIPGEQPDTDGWIKLNTNENPYPPSPRVEERIRAVLPKLSRYPNPTSAKSRAALADHFQLDKEQVIVGNGSDDILNLLVRVYGGPNHPVAALDPGYSLYPILVGIQNAPFQPIPINEDLSLPLQAIRDSGANLFFLTSPNAPLGVGFSNKQITALAEGFPGILVVDEAYGDFAEESAVSLVRSCPGLVITRSLSKSHSLAGLRVGFALADPGVIEQLDKVRDSYNVDSLAQAGLLGALSDPDYYRATIGKIRNIRNYYLNWFKDRGWDTFPSQANFITTRPTTNSGEWGVEVARSCYQHLKSRKILVRHFPDSCRVESYLRISVGTEMDMEALENEINVWWESSKS